MRILFWISISAIVYSYGVYPLLLLALCRRNRPETVDRRPETAYWPSVTVIVSAYNEEKVIGGRIDNLLTADYPKEKMEILIGSDGSTDNTNNIIDGYASRGVKSINRDYRRGKASVVNDLIEAAAGEIIILTDANTIYEKDAIQKLARGFADGRVGCVCGELIFRNTKEGDVIDLEGIYWRYEQSMKRIEGANGSLLGANGGIYAIRKSLFEPLKQETIIDDFLIPMKILERGYRVIYEEQAIAYEETTEKVAQEMERRIRIGAGDFQTLAWTWHLLNPARGFPAFAYFSHKVLRWFGPFFLICALLTNILLPIASFYGFTLALQVIFYAAAVLGSVMPKRSIKIKLVSVSHYFLSMNIALFLGFIRFCTNSQSVTWKRTER